MSQLVKFSVSFLLSHPTELSLIDWENDIEGSAKSPEHFEDYKLLWSGFIEQKVPIVCFKAGSDDIVGANMLFVLQKDDDYMDEAYKQVNFCFFF